MKGMRRFLQALLISTLLLSASLLLDFGRCDPPAGSGPVSMWSTFHGDARRNGWAAGLAPARGDILWSFDTGASVQSSPVLGGGLLYIGADNGRLYALRPSTGEEVWNRSFGEFATLQSTPAYWSGMLFFGSQNGSNSGLFALNASDGSVIWSVADDRGIAASPAVEDGTVFSCSQNGTVIAVNASSGEVLWTAAMGGEMWSSPAVAQGCVYGGTITGEAFALWAANGSLRWNITFPQTWTIYSSPSVSGDTVYIGASSYSELGGEILAVNSSTGAMIWRFLSCQGDYSTAAATDGAVFAHVWNKTAGGSFLVALPAEDPNGDGTIAPGELLWSFQTMDFEGGSSPLVADNFVIVGSSDGNVYAVGRQTGKPAWNATIGGKIVGSPALFERRVFAGSMDGKVCGLGSASELPALRISTMLEKESLPSGTVMRINVRVTDEAGNPAEGAFVKFAVSAGNLSQSGASTFPDGSQTVKYLAPPVKGNISVTLAVSAAKGGFAPASASMRFNVTVYRSSYSGVSSQSGFNMVKYAPYLAIIAVLGLCNAAVLVLLVRKRWLPGQRRMQAGGG
jgi:outer membrane protein assembly factor BamB